MLIVTLIDSNGASTVLGVLGCERIAPVADYIWASVSNGTVTPVATLRAYSRWTEPAAALLARLLAIAPGDKTDWPLVERFTCEVRLGSRYGTGRLIESIDVVTELDYVHVTHRDELGEHSTRGPARAHYASLAELLTHAARLAVWGVDIVPPIPEPLTTVPVHKDDCGHAYVLERDMPEHVRRHVVARKVGCTQPKLGAFFEWDWTSFIGASRE